MKENKQQTPIIIYCDGGGAGDGIMSTN